MVRPAERNGDNTRSCNFGAVTRDQLGSLGSSSSSSSSKSAPESSSLLFAVSPCLTLSHNQITPIVCSPCCFPASLLTLTSKPPRLPCGPFSRCAALSYCPLSERPHPYYDRPSVLANYSNPSIVKPATYLIIYIYSVGGCALGLCACAFPQRPWW